MNGSGKGTAAPGSGAPPPPHPVASGGPGAPSGRPLVYLTGARPSRPPSGPGAGSRRRRSSPSPAPHPPSRAPAPGVCPAPSSEAGPTSYTPTCWTLPVGNPGSMRLAVSFSTMSSWNAPYTCSALRVFTQFKKNQSLF